MSDGRCSCGHAEQAHKDKRDDWTACALCQCVGHQPPPRQPAKEADQDICDIITDKSVDWLGEYYRTPMAGFGGYTLAALRSAGYAVVKLPESVEKLNGDMEWGQGDVGIRDGALELDNRSIELRVARQIAAALLVAADIAEYGPTEADQ